MTLREWWQLTRPPTLPASVVPVAVGTAAGSLSGPVSPEWTALMLVVALLLQVATNLTNEYADFARGIDGTDSVGIAGVIVSGQMTVQRVRRCALVTYGVALALGLVLVAVRGPVLLVLGLLAILTGFLYNAGPRPLSATPFGEVVVFLMMGPIEVLASEMAATGRLTVTALAASIGVGLTVAAILLANNLRDRIKDAGQGRQTLAIRLGAVRGLKNLLALVLAGLLWPLVAAAIGILPWPAALPLLAVPVAVRTTMGLQASAELRRAVLVVGRVHLLAGMLLAAGLWAGHW